MGKGGFFAIDKRPSQRFMNYWRLSVCRASLLLLSSSAKRSPARARRSSLNAEIQKCKRQCISTTWSTPSNFKREISKKAPGFGTFEIEFRYLGNGLLASWVIIGDPFEIEFWYIMVFESYGWWLLRNWIQKHGRCVVSRCYGWL